MKNIAGLKKENLSKQIIRALSLYILENKLKSGDKLPTEMVLAEQFQVGRNAVREALKALEVIGLVHSKPSVGTILTIDGPDSSLLPLIFGLVLQDTGMKYLTEMRLVVEQGALNMAIPNATEAEIEELRSVGVVLDKKMKMFLAHNNQALELEIIQLEVEFHQKLVAMSRNPILMKFSMLWDVLFKRANPTDSLRIDNQQATADADEATRVFHTDIVDCIADRNLDKAQMCLKRHLRFWLSDDLTITNDAFLDMVK